ncbi:efflux RND transporter periplasmic adaptor subunit [Synechococcus sp. HB1133]|uniref:efflux RND transporter periplasmic adaptor subunit n=1 Tax=unclassified Synechococcus TaxID=2626047 RepID=UPI00140A1BF8|nr:efflux RND transporter periplasmic adaptor subunit [Synechococcus sp. HBA1120]MCB4421424.1 efflux RND transporter periplasmic adaptor subunit [Synechococcus sp. HB1133]MCB4431225.1 efflux RND transporter periplasmic adaptor subunit [Synechococcus sp. HBA1120]NHI80366.1 efflux RND transporter periplasmic adaptor subunit [Synechococcus sp. HB1133]
MAMRSATKAALLVASGVVLSLSGCGTKPTNQFLSIQTSRIEQATFFPAIEAISPLESTSNVEVKPQIDGTVVQILATAGQPVKAGQVILVLDNVQQSAALDAARSEARKDVLNAERYAYLYKQGAVSAKERDRYANEAVKAEDEARSDAAELGYKFVRAPIDGVIGDLDSVKLGDYVKTGETITGIVDNSTLWTLMEIPASEASAVKVGQTVKLVSQTTPAVSGEGKVTFVSPYYGISGSNNAPNTLMVKAEFPNLTGQLKTGQFVASEIITGNQFSLAVPVQAVMMQAQQPFVYKVVPLNKALPKIKASANASEQVVKKLERLPADTPIVVQTKVQLGDLQDNAYPVKAGLNAGDQVAISNTSRLRSGMPVQVKSGAN